jgi:hypothetical protein
MIQITSTIWTIEVPIDAENVSILFGEAISFETQVDETERCRTGYIEQLSLPIGQWQLIGTIWNDGDDLLPYPFNDSKDFQQAKRKFRSLLASKNLHWVNPFGEAPEPMNYSQCGDNPIYKKDLANWQQAENALIKGKLAIIKKI